MYEAYHQMAKDSRLLRIITKAQNIVAVRFTYSLIRVVGKGVKAMTISKSTLSSSSRLSYL